MESNENLPFKAGYVAVLGRPNVGKSTLINALMGQKIAAVSPKPQTTRRRQMGILTLPEAQVVFIDTPGVHQARSKLGETMNQAARETLEESDVILLLVDVSEPPSDEDQLLFNLLVYLRQMPPLILVLNKIDQISNEELEPRSEEYLRRLPEQAAEHTQVVPVSAIMSVNLDKLSSEILSRLPEGDPFFPEEQVTDLYERDIAADLIREAALIHLRDEVPHGITVRIDEFTERSERGAFIAATIFVERDSHKGIVIGQGGEMLKKIGTTARQEIEGMSDRKVFLDLRVKVRKNWRNDEKFLRWFGYE
jgi:GTPase